MSAVPPALAALDAELAAAPGLVSVYCGRLGAPPAYTRLPDATHYAASTMKVAVLVALYRAGEAGAVDLDAPVPVDHAFASAAPGGGRYACSPADDNDPLPWQRLGATASLRWLAGRMIVCSSNLATNLVLARVGLPAVAQVWRLAGARHSVVGRGIDDAPARDAGITNLVTARDLAALLTAVALGAAGGAPGVPVAGAPDCREMLDVLLAQQRREDLAAGLPPGTRIAHKNGWVRGVRHGAGVVFPADAPPYALVGASTTELSDRAACRLLSRLAAASWADRRVLG